MLNFAQASSSVFFRICCSDSVGEASEKIEEATTAYNKRVAYRVLSLKTSDTDIGLPRPSLQQNDGH
jgi:hypothetical protein